MNHLTRRGALRSGTSATGLVDPAVGDDLEAFEPTGEALHFTADGYVFAPFRLGNREPYHLCRRRR
jgi:uncharacterized protein